MPRALFCLYSRRDREAEQKLQVWQQAYSRQRWETTILSHGHGPGFVHEIRLDRPRGWPWLAWRLHGTRRISREIRQDPALRVLWCGFPPALQARLQSRVGEAGQGFSRVAFGPRGQDEEKIGADFSAIESVGPALQTGPSAPFLEENAVYDLRCGGEKNPYHWLMYSLAPLAACRRSRCFRILLNPDPSEMQLGSLRCLGISREQVLTQPPAGPVHPLPLRSLDLSAAVEILRRELTPPKASPRVGSVPVYVSRRDAAYRRLIDEERILAMDPAIRPRYVVMSLLPWEEQVALFRQAPLVMGVHGAAFVFTVFSPKGTTLVEFFPGNYERDHFRRLAQVCGLGWERIGCKPIGRQGRRCREADLRLGSEGQGQVDKILRRFQA